VAHPCTPNPLTHPCSSPAPFAQCWSPPSPRNHADAGPQSAAPSPGRPGAHQLANAQHLDLGYLAEHPAVQPGTGWGSPNGWTPRGGEERGGGRRRCLASPLPPLHAPLGPPPPAARKAPIPREMTAEEGPPLPYFTAVRNFSTKELVAPPSCIEFRSAIHPRGVSCSGGFLPQVSDQRVVGGL